MNRNVGIAMAVGIAVIIGVISFQIYDSSYQRSTTDDYYENLGQVKNVVYPENPQKLKGVIINKDKYLLGENVFIRVNDIPMGLRDYLLFFTPGGTEYMSIYFDGSERSSFKHYFKPALVNRLNICEKDDLIGQWTIMFAGLPNDKIHFEVVKETLPNSEEYFKGCAEAREYPMIKP